MSHRTVTGIIAGPMPPIAISKTKLLRYLQCPRRLWLEQYSPELEDEEAYDQAAIETGRVVGAKAREIYGKGDGHLVSHNRGLRSAVAETTELLEAGGNEPIFEATFNYDGLTVQVDVLDRSGNAPRIVEVKSSTSVKDHFLADCAIQSWTLGQLGIATSGTALALVDTGFVYAGDGDYDGLFREVDVTPDLAPQVDGMPDVVAATRETLESLDEPDRDVGTHCTTPYLCPFFSHCAPEQNEAPGAEHPRRSVELSQIVRALDYPRYFLDFETISLAIPIWPSTRPYQALPYQWSCHVDDGTGTIRHEEHLDLSGEPPMRQIAEELIGKLGTSGPIIVYSSYEKRVLNELAERYADLAPALGALTERIVDLYPIAKQHYYHPGMRGSWSLKAILPTIGADVDYSVLDEVQDGKAAQSAYLEAIDEATTGTRRDDLRTALLAYCRLDTLALVRLTEFFSRDNQD